MQQHARIIAQHCSILLPCSIARARSGIMGSPCSGSASSASSKARRVRRAPGSASSPKARRVEPEESSDLFVVVEPAHEGSEEYCRDLSQVIGKQFRERRLSLTGGILRALKAAHESLRDWNRRSLKQHRVAAGVSCLALRGAGAHLDRLPRPGGAGGGRRPPRRLPGAAGAAPPGRRPAPGAARGVLARLQPPRAARRRPPYPPQQGPGGRPLRRGAHGGAPAATGRDAPPPLPQGQGDAHCAALLVAALPETAA